MSGASQARRARILDAGLSLVSREGLAGLTLGVLAERVGMSKSGLFAYFRSKENVQIALLSHLGQFGERYVTGPAMGTPEGLPRLRALFGAWLGWSERAELPGGCPFAAAIFELDDLEGPVREHVVEIQRRWNALLGGIIARAVELGHLREDADVEQVRWEINGIYLGHHASQRLMRDPQADARAYVAFEALIDRVLPEVAA